MRDFSLSLKDVSRIGSGLCRPECVLTTACGDLYVSDERGGVTRIARGGATTLFASRTGDGQPLGANGFAMLADGSFLVAPLAGGGVYRLHRDGRAELAIAEADGQPLSYPNFVLLDHSERLWICCLTHRPRASLCAYAREAREGFIVLVDRRGARIVAGGIGYPNEVRIDPTGRWLYTNETLAARLLRYPLRPDGSLGSPEVVLALDESNMFDGFELDSQGGAWITALVSNRLWYVSPEGRARVLIEDAHAEQLARLTELQKTTGVTRALLYEEHGTTLRNISSVAFGGPDLRTVYLGSLMGDHVVSFRVPVAGMPPVHWNFGPFA
jgi:sugar lactone lactonase YvrE